MATVRFFAETGGKLIVEGYARILQGWNEMDENAVRQYGIDTLPYVKMPDGWQRDLPEQMFRATSLAPQVAATEIAPEEFAYHPEHRDQPTTTLEKRVAEIQEANKEALWSPSRVIAMDLKRAKAAIAEQTDVKKLVELLQFAKSKPSYKKAVIARIKELDPENTWAGAPPQVDNTPDEGEDA